MKKNGKWKLSKNWFELNKLKRKEWVETSLNELEKETSEAKLKGEKIHPLQLSLDLYYMWWG